MKTTVPFKDLFDLSVVLCKIQRLLLFKQTWMASIFPSFNTLLESICPDKFC